MEQLRVVVSPHEGHPRVFQDGLGGLVLEDVKVRRGRENVKDILADHALELQLPDVHRVQRLPIARLGLRQNPRRGGAEVCDRLGAFLRSGPSLPGVADAGRQAVVPLWPLPCVAGLWLFHIKLPGLVLVVVAPQLSYHRLCGQRVVEDAVLIGFHGHDLQQQRPRLWGLGHELDPVVHGHPLVLLQPCHEAAAVGRLVAEAAVPAEVLHELGHSAGVVLRDEHDVGDAPPG
mmetsp:Transcript_21094/g.66696  ORF Transcript_21094/g.66696 Transcript_21094/m.66696 type:complete len:232 (+) Transcript_21094:343-1038(+)